MLNDITIRSLAAPQKGAKQYPDGKIPGFGVRVTSTGVKSFYLTYRLQGRSQRLNLGRYPTITLAKARSKAHAALAEISEARDPRPEKEQPAKVLHFDEGVDLFIERYCSRYNRPSTAMETERLLKSHFVSTWKRRNITDITKADVVLVLEKIMARGTPATARHAFAAIRKFFNWTVEQGLIEDSPCRTMKPPAKAIDRERVLTDEELATVWRASVDQSDTFGIIVRLLILTAQRRGEVCAMRWDELDFEQQTWTLAGERTKNHKSHCIPISGTAIEILRSIPQLGSPYVFPARGKPHQSYTGYSKGKRKLNAKVEITDWTLHDLRRTAATGMARLDVEPHVIERVLNHVSGTFSGVAGVYNRHKYLDSMRRALSVWDRHVQGLVV